MNNSHNPGEEQAGADSDQRARYEKAQSYAATMLNELVTTPLGTVVCVGRTLMYGSNFLHVYNIAGQLVQIYGEEKPQIADSGTEQVHQIAGLAVFGSFDETARFDFTVAPSQHMSALVRQHNDRYLSVEVTDGPEWVGQLNALSAQLGQIPVTASTGPEA